MCVPMEGDTCTSVNERHLTCSDWREGEEGVLLCGDWREGPSWDGWDGKLWGGGGGGKECGKTSEIMSLKRLYNSCM